MVAALLTREILLLALCAFINGEHSGCGMNILGGIAITGNQSQATTMTRNSKVM
jgi:hypothetical protein